MQLGHQEQLGQPEQLEQLAVLELLEILGQLAHLVRQDLQESKVLQELPDSLDITGLAGADG